jgi:erythromycin esterase
LASSIRKDDAAAAARTTTGLRIRLSNRNREASSRFLHRAPWRYSFVDFSNAKRERGSEWIWTAVNALEWGRGLDRLVPRNEYDGVLFIDTAHPPHYR